MHNSSLNGSNANGNASQTISHTPQTSDLDQPSPSITMRRNEKHVLYTDDYTTEEEEQPPSYRIAQELAEASHTSDVDMIAPSARQFPSSSSSDAIPLDPYHAYLPSEPETAPLMEPDSDRHTPPTAPPIDQIEISIHSPFDRYKRVRQCSGTRFLLAFAVFVAGVILMATALATIKCYSDGCESDADCKICEDKTEKGFQAAGFSFFILISFCIIWQIIKYIVL